ncbi:head GIN domain-containing protein [Novosphingobium olei]|uniref:DUF2807 domain-containing protein n=1 Tax=Novosphingobium olei TaxID=2728851 RepID=A0A7Y0GA19_9SPHN|nr:head GIN domain-containing protein [Novosphingobium olei]NML94595.1 DUF2807 domain-containing protein [Novosphingobium olei]BEV02415.1 DUF2807 domain-containing protein [Novosphingobium olei]
MLKDFAKTLAGVAFVGLAAALSGCDAASVTIDGAKGVPLAQLDLSGKAPDEITLLGPDKVHVTRGDRLAITVDGEQPIKDKLRFTLKDGKLGIARDSWKSSDSDEGIATVNVTVPAARELVLAGSGQIDIDGLEGETAKLTIAGSGTIAAAGITAKELKVDVVGSGKLRGAGNTGKLEMTIAGSGNAELDGLVVQSAKIDVAGSGSTRFASDGEVKANIMGSGEVRVKGRATCKVSSMGSGRLVCEP